MKALAWLLWPFVVVRALHRQRLTIANELATLTALEQDALQPQDRDWIRGARFALLWIRGDLGALRPAEGLRRARLARRAPV